MMERQRGIGAHIEKFYATQLAHAQVPNVNLLNSLKSLQQIKRKKDESINTQLKLHKQISKYITYEEVKKLKQSKQRLKENEKILKVVQICKEIDLKVVTFEKYVEDNTLERKTGVQEMLECFKALYLLIQKLDHEFNCLSAEQQPTNQLPISKSEQIEALKNTYLKKLKTKFYKSIVQKFYSKKKTLELEASLQYFKLPIKKNNERQSSQANQVKIQFSQNISNPNYVQNGYCIIEALFCEYCCYCLQKKIDVILQEEEEQLRNERDSIIGDAEAITKVFISPFFSKLWHKINKSIIYIFMNTSFNMETSAYQIDEPNWLFDYMEQVFSFNYTFIDTGILKLLRNKSETKQIAEFIQTYFISFNMLNFFLKFIIMRLEADIKVIKQGQKNEKKISTSTKNHNSFIMFNFLDELNILSQKIYEVYDHESNFIESVIQWADKNSTFDILAMNFDYEHEWIEQRIFNDFSNINYSNITDLKNVEAYNITINFTHIFEKLYSKFRKINDQHIKTRINQFYYDKLLHLVRHITTSFERIYNYSGIDKYETLISYKKVEDEFRGYFSGFIRQSPIFEQKINEEYYSILQKYVSVLALEELTSVHKKVYKRLSDNNDAFTVENNELEDMGNNKTKWNKIFEEWKQKLNKIYRLQPQYEDKKMRNIFFVFLESVEFTEDGFLYFISLFQPFLVILFSIEGTNTIKMLIEMEKGTLKEYCKSHQNSLWFLSSNQLRSIEKARIKTTQL